MSDNAIECSEQLVAMLRSHVERCLQEIWSDPSIDVDDDGDYPFRCETAACWVSVLDDGDPSVRVFAHAAHDVPRSARMLGELNELNSRSRWAKISWRHGVVLVDLALPWTAVNQTHLQRALDAVTTVADDIGSMIATVYGGTTPFPLDLESVDHDEDAA